MPSTGAARIRPMNQDIDVHSSAEKSKLLTFIVLDVSLWYLVVFIKMHYLLLVRFFTFCPANIIYLFLYIIKNMKKLKESLTLAFDSEYKLCS